jgi:DNA-binding LacI/PurR family transcriptional regulator
MDPAHRHGADQELLDAGYHPSLFSYSTSATGEVERLVAKIDQSAETLGGMVLFLSPAIYGLTDELDKREIPWITINRVHEHASQNFVAQDAFTAARLIGRCLARMNVQRVAVLSDAMQPGKSSADKFFGLLQGYVERGKPSRNVDYLACGGWHEQDGYEQMETYVEQFGPPGVVFASGDLLALGAIRCLRERKLRVPSEVGVIGATGLRMGEYTHPSLTVMANPMERMGQEAARMLLQMSRENVSRLIGRYVPAPLIVRESFPIAKGLIEEEGAGLQ